MCKQRMGRKMAQRHTLRCTATATNNNNNNNNNNKHASVCAQLHFNICKETGAPLLPQIIIIIIIINMIVCVHNYTSTYARKRGYNWTKKHWYEHVPKSVETSQGG